MSDQMTSDLETRLQGWLVGRAPTDVPAVFAQRVAAIPRSAPRARPVRLADASRAGRGTRPMLLAAAVVAMTLALIAGGVFIATSRHDSKLPVTTVVATAAPTPTAPPTPTPAPTVPPDSAVLPAVIPDTTEHGSIDTPLGAARWIHLQGDPTTLPEPLEPMALPDGRLAWFQQGGPGVACAIDLQSTACTDPPPPVLSIADDILAPRQIQTLPIDSAEADLRLIGETFWLITTDPFTVWRSSDLTDWTKVDASGLRSPGPASIAWTTDLSPFAVVADSTVASVHYVASDPGSLLGYPGEQVRLAKAGPGGGFTANRYRPRSQGGSLVLGPITVDEVARGIRFIDGAGKEVGRVDGVGREFAESWAARGEIRYDRIAAFDGTAWSTAELPVTQPVDWPIVVPLDGSAMVFVTEPDTHVRAWRTTDGRTWTGGALILDATGTPIESGGVTYRGVGKDQVIVALSVDGTTSWTSTDGERWVTGPEDSSVPAPVQFDHGFMRTGDQTGGRWQVSRDGTTFEDIPALESVVTKLAPGGAGGSTEFAIGDTVFFVVTEDQGSQTRDMWIIEFEAPSP